MNKSKAGSKPQIITFNGLMNEIKDIMGQLSLRSLYSLLACARGLKKADEAARRAIEAGEYEDGL